MTDFKNFIWFNAFLELDLKWDCVFKAAASNRQNVRMP